MGGCTSGSMKHIIQQIVKKDRNLYITRCIKCDKAIIFKGKLKEVECKSCGFKAKANG